MSDPLPDDDRRTSADRRAGRERRTGQERRSGVIGTVPTQSERRTPADRRRGQRRAGLERRFALPIAQQLRTVIDLLFSVDPGRLGDEDRRRFDAAILRLRFTLDRVADQDD